MTDHSCASFHIVGGGMKQHYQRIEDTNILRSPVNRNMNAPKIINEYHTIQLTKIVVQSELYNSNR